MQLWDALVISLGAGADDAKKAAVPKKPASMADHIITPDMLKFTPAPPVLPAGCDVLFGGMKMRRDLPAVGDAQADGILGALLGHVPIQAGDLPLMIRRD